MKKNLKKVKNQTQANASGALHEDQKDENEHEEGEEPDLSQCWWCLA